MRAVAVALAALCCCVAAAGCGGSSGPATGAASGSEPTVPLPAGEPPSKLVVKDMKVGSGKRARAGDEVVVRFVADYVTGERFESSWEEGHKPFRFILGAGETGPGWEHGLRGMRVGGRRELIVPPGLSSADRSAQEEAAGDPAKTLVFVVDLLAANGTAERKEPRLEIPPGAPPKRLLVRDLIEGTGPVAREGDTITVEYIGKQYDGYVIGDSWKRSKPFRFTLGKYDAFVPPGWQRGIPGMRVGGRRELVIPPRLLYQREPPPGTKASETAIYLIDLVSIGRR